MNQSHNIVFLTSRHIGSVIFLNKILKSGFNIKAIFISKNLNPGPGSYKDIFNKFISLGPGLTTRILTIMLGSYLGLYLSALYPVFGKKQKMLSLEQLCKKHGIHKYEIDDVNSDETCMLIKSQEPDILVCSIFNQILKQKIYKIPKINCVNIHLGLSQQYRGLNSYFWVLVNNEKESGVTIHEVDDGIDSGKIISQKTVKIDRTDSAMGFFIKLCKESAELFRSSLGNVIQKQSTINNTSESQYYSYPTKNDYKKFVDTGRKFFTLGDFKILFWL